MKLPTIESVKSFAAPGSSVLVHSFGCWYPGTVMSFGRTRVKVMFWTKGGATAGGKPRTKTFEPGYVVPVGTYAEGRKGQPEPFSEQRCRQALWEIGYHLGKGDAAKVEEAKERAMRAGCEQHEIDAVKAEVVA
jgi:hypothetical protein